MRSCSRPVYLVTSSEASASTRSIPGYRWRLRLIKAVASPVGEPATASVLAAVPLVGTALREFGMFA
ncbi:hypothetical protein [Fodinibius sp. AD559]|uniref:hypothetical protein n=1 Tax=Fodinibius sp. AD559 TaxID=3424179 RepID=UPI004046A68C